jgi:excinuclease ABC subunit B
MNVQLSLDQKLSKRELMEQLVRVHYGRTTADLNPGQFRAVGNRVDVMPVSEKVMYSIIFSGNQIGIIHIINPVNGMIIESPEHVFLFPAKHFLTEGEKKEKALVAIEKEMKDTVKKFEKEGKLLEAERIKRRTQNDLSMMREMGYCSGIENYSRHLSGKKAGEAPETLLSYFPKDFLTVIDESHVTLPQLHGMYAGDASRKKTLIEFGFRLPSASDNRPMQYPEFDKKVGQTVYVSATPSKLEIETSDQVVEQIIRPTGLIDPAVEIRPVTPAGDYPGQIQDFINETEAEIKKGGRVIATTLTKKMAERQKLIDDSIANAKKVQDNLIMSEQKYQEKIDMAKVEANKILEKATTEAALVGSQMKVKAKEEIEMLVESAKKNIRIEKEDMVQNLKKETASLVVLAVEKILQEKMTDKKDTQLITEMVAKMK